jgi:anti-sigma factor ChrR (cupin superfamily)
MKIHADVSLRACVQSDQLNWVASTMPGVERKMIARDGDEIALATSIVRYAPKSHFFKHSHELGEEYIVLEGIFSDEFGHYGPGTYVKNPPGSSHTPYTNEGCTIFVKLRHMKKEDTQHVVIDTTSTKWLSGPVPGISVMPLSGFGAEHTAFIRWDPGTRLNTHTHVGGEEVFVLEGVLQDEHGIYPKGSWLRNPHLSTHTPFSEQGCILFEKAGHLPIINEGVA